MATEKVKRKLAAILSADVKGYSRLMGEDEEGTLQALRSCKEVMINLFRQYGGRVVGTAGDSLLVEFASVVDAVKCGVEIQKELKSCNADLTEERRMEFRIGINLGDVIEEEDTIYGDGVNIAARVQSLAEGGGICISATVYDQVEKKLKLGYEYLGEQTVKNIAGPIRVYRVRMEPETASAKVDQEKKPVGRRLSKAALGMIAVLVIAGAVILYLFALRPSPPKTEVAAKEKMAFPLPDKPSIAVVPFVNMSEDPKQEFLCDGITEEIITALSKVRNLFVISRQSTSTYKGKPVKVKQVSEELGVRYILEGSVQRSGDRIRITAQLIDALTGNHLWAERYDRDLRDVFALQDEITLKIITALQVKLTAGETVHVMAKGAKNIDAFIKYMQATELLQNKEANAQARGLLEEAIALDPEYPRLYVGLAMTHIMDVWFSTTESNEQSLARAFELAQKAISLDDSNAAAYSTLGWVYAMKRQYDKAIAECERAVSLSPNSADNLMRLGLVLTWAGRAEEGTKYLQQAIRLYPFPPASYYNNLAVAYRDSGQYEKAIEECKKALQRDPNSQFPYIHMAVSYIRLGREEEARAAAAEILRINPKFSLEHYAKIIPFTQPVVDRVIEDLRQAGLK